MGVVPAAGVEPATFRSGGERSNPLSYAGVGWEEKIARIFSHKKAQKNKEAFVFLVWH